MKTLLCAIAFAVSAAFLSARSALYYDTSSRGILDSSLYPGSEGTLYSEDGFLISSSLSGGSLTVQIERGEDGGMWRSITMHAPEGFSFEPGLHGTVPMDVSVLFGVEPAGLSVMSAGRGGLPFSSDGSVWFDFGRAGWIDILQLEFGLSGSVSAAAIDMYQVSPTDPGFWSFESLRIDSSIPLSDTPDALIPEPSAYAAILGTFVLGIAFLARRKRSAS